LTELLGELVELLERQERHRTRPISGYRPGRARARIAEIRALVALLEEVTPAAAVEIAVTRVGERTGARVVSASRRPRRR